VRKLALLLLTVCVAVPAANAESGLKRPKIEAKTSKLSASAILNHELWGQTTFGDGYVYGPLNRKAGMAVVDLDTDGDPDFVFPSSVGQPEWMVNYGSTAAFYPGGSRALEVQNFPAGFEYDLGLDFGDLNGDTLPDMVAILRSREPFIKRVAWFRNLGPREQPKFQFVNFIYTSPQSGTWDGIWLSLADTDGDQDIDLYVSEAFTATSDRPHRLFQCLNTGSPTVPQIGVPQEVVDVSQLLPDRLPIGKAEKDRIEKRLDSESFQKREGLAKGQQFSYNMGDIAFYDWDLDGDLDFLFYSREVGLFWIENVGTKTAPEWANVLADEGDPLYEHAVADGTTLEEASIGFRVNPNGARPGAEWLDETFLSVNNRLKIIRYVIDFGYVPVNVNAVAFYFDRGPAAFWDYDYDGDLDMFKASAEGANSRLMLIENGGTVYAPAWDDTFVPITGIPMNPGEEQNNYREDLFTIATYDTEGNPALFVQRQNGTIDLYFDARDDTSQTPQFRAFPNAFPEVIYDGDVVVAPAGVAAADFDGDGLVELVVAYKHEVGDTWVGELVVVDLFEEDGRLKRLVYPYNYLLIDEEGEPLDPSLIESLSAGDVDGDGRPDLLVTTSGTPNHAECETHVYHNNFFELFEGLLFAEFENVGRLDTVYNTDKSHARMTSLADVDGDSDLDLFVSHRYPDGDFSSLRSYVRFYRNNNPTGLRYTRFRMTAGSEKALTIPLVAGPGGQVTFVAPEYREVQNTSGGALSAGAVYRAGAFAPSVDIFDTLDLRSRYGTTAEMRSFVDVLPAVGANESKAVIVVGDTADGDLYPTFAGLAGFAYRVLQGEGLAKSNIRMYAAGPIDTDDDGISDVTAVPQLATLRETITTWGATPKKLLVYLIDHGQRDRFRLNATEFLEASEYADWLDQIQPALNQGPLITTIIDTCESGSFIDDIAGHRRINITGANVGPTGGVAMFDKNQFISFSLSFWGWMYYGNGYGASFRYAKNAIESLNPLQQPQIDDDGNGVANEPNDGILADANRPGADFEGARAIGVHWRDRAERGNQLEFDDAVAVWRSGAIPRGQREGDHRAAELQAALGEQRRRTAGD
jgi:hypothetical protein